MNIGIDAKVLARRKAGTGRYTGEILKELQKIDNRNKYFLFEKKTSDFTVVNPLWRKICIKSFLPGTLWFIFRLPFAVRKYDIDVFWGPENIIPVLFFPGKIKMIATVHDITFTRFPSSLQLWNYLVTIIFQKLSIKKSDCILAVSDFTKNEIMKNYGKMLKKDCIKVIYNGSPEWEIPSDYSLSGRKDHLLFVGSMEPRKNLITLFKALLILRRSKETVKIRIAGPKGWKNKKELEFIESNNMQDIVTITGYLTEEELLNEYLSCRALIYPSVYEGFGLPVLEALKTDTVVLTSRGTVMEEIGGDCVLLFDPESPEDIAEKISFVYSEKFHRESCLAGRQELLSKFSWSRSAKEIYDVFSSFEKSQQV